MFTFNNHNSQAVVPCPTQIRLPFSSLRPIFRARTVSDAPPFDPTSVISLQACFWLITVFLFSAAWFSTLFLTDIPKLLQLMFSKFEHDGKLNPTFAEGAFQLPVSSIQTYIKDPICPRFNNSFHLDIFYY